jgi:pyruvate/2-oxoglutarate dehydrogenase complex dihydrolipoamide acyltransferase (E2) component
MPSPVYAPCVNINDDKVLVINLRVAEGDRVGKGDVLADVETVKAAVEVEAERDGYVLGVVCQVDQEVPVGSVMMWLGDSPDETVPAVDAVPQGEPARQAVRPTAKAQAMLKQLRLDAASVPATGERLTVADIEAYLSRQGRSVPGASAPKSERKQEPAPTVPGEFHDLTHEELGMALTVSWHRDHAAATYLELEYDPAPWELYAAAYAERHRLMLSPLLPLLAYRLVEVVRDAPRINATMIDGRKYQYAPINLGFTVQAGETLYLTVVRDAGMLDAAGFIQALGEVQRHAMQKKLRPEESSGATVAFSSMARWNVSRHVPILPPYVSLMIAHAAPKGSGRAVLGASYDHRVLSGFDVARALQTLAQPPQQ